MIYRNRVSESIFLIKNRSSLLTMVPKMGIDNEKYFSKIGLAHQK